MRAIFAIITLPLVAATLGAQANHGRSATAEDSVPMSVKASELLGARYAQIPDSSPSNRRGPSKIGTRCVEVGEGREVESGGFWAGPFELYSQIWHTGYAKLWWRPARFHFPNPPRLVVRAARLDRHGSGVVFEEETVASAGPWPPQPGDVVYTTGFRLPSPGRWLLTATAGSDWGCFIFEFK